MRTFSLHPAFICLIVRSILSRDGEEKNGPWPGAIIPGFNSWFNVNLFKDFSCISLGSFHAVDAVSLLRPLFPATPSPPRLPPCSAGPGAGRKPVINRRSRDAIWGKMATFRSRLRTSGVTRQIIGVSDSPRSAGLSADAGASHWHWRTLEAPPPRTVNEDACVRQRDWSVCEGV